MKFRVPLDKNVLKLINKESGALELDPYEIDVLVWNIYKGKIEKWDEEFDKLTEDKEILILQESLMHTRVSDEYKRRPWYQFIFATAWYRPKFLNSETGVVTAAVAKTLRKQWQRSFYSEPILGTPKMTLFTEYKLKGEEKTLLVGNIHGINFVTDYKFWHMLKKAAKVISKHNGPVIFAGDFNTWNADRMNIMNKTLKGLKMKTLSFKNDIRKKFRGHPLDHLWVRGLKVIQKAVLRTTRSDHNPIIAKLSTK